MLSSLFAIDIILSSPVGSVDHHITGMADSLNAGEVSSCLSRIKGALLRGNRRDLRSGGLLGVMNAGVIASKTYTADSPVHHASHPSSIARPESADI